MSIRPERSAARVPTALPTRPRIGTLCGSTSVLAIALAVPALLVGSNARAQNIYSCPTPTEIFTGLVYYEGSCTVPESEGYTGARADFTLGLPAEYTVTNGASLTGTAPNQTTGLYVYFQGTNGSSDGNSFGQAGAEVTVTNTGNIHLEGGSSASENGAAALIDVQSKGGTGVNGSRYDNGGNGGGGGPVTVTNSGYIQIDGSVGASLPGEAVFGIRARSLGSDGGDQGDANVGDQNGGAGGAGGDVTVTNEAAIAIGASNSLYAAKGNALAITAQSYGATGGNNNGAGGTGGTITVTNTDDISVYVDVESGMTGFVSGINARSIGGDGILSQDNSNNGGAGANANTITITHTGTLTIGGDIEAANLTEAGDYSAGIYAISQGGVGGQGNTKSNGGVGGSASVDSTTTVTLDGSAAASVINVSGDTVMGVLVRNLGGNGGAGDGDKSDYGGAGGHGNAIKVSMIGDASITTDGEAAYGVVGQSVGGIGGGNADQAGAGGTGGAVTFDADAGTSIKTTGDFAGGVTLHTVGGGGGVGADFTRVLAGAQGGDGGNGGNAGAAEITSGATVITSGKYAHGLLGQSVGGGGGAGGIGTSLTVALGGNGGEGGAGGNITINHTGVVNTSGYGAMGIVAQTLSGGGGAAGMSGGILSVGGDAGSASNNSGSANVNLDGDVITEGDAATGVLAQSIGGGGGSAAGSAGVIAIGGSGSAGGGAGVVDVYQVGGLIQTSGTHAPGIQAQSIGGGGGSGGDVIDASVGLGVGVGGTSSSGGNGNAVCIANNYENCGAGPTDSSNAPTGTSLPIVATEGDHSIGILAQSVGGGGGSGGSASGASAGEIINMQVGGSASTGGSSGYVDVSYVGLTAMTAGDNAHGIVAQSIGGGGGTGGDASSVGVLDIVPLQVGGSGGSGGFAAGVMVDLSTSSVTTTGAQSAGIVAQSIGGGGGTGGSASGFDASAGLAMDVAVGANGGSGGNGGFTNGAGDDSVTEVTLTDSTVLTGFNTDQTPNYDATTSFGLLVQSVGGGGGMGGSSSARAIAVAVPDFEGQSFAFTATASVGGSGGAAGAGYDAKATLNGTSMVATGGDGSHGIVVQSIAHGGGTGGDASAMGGTIGDMDTVSATVNAAIGNSGGAGGTSRDVTVEINDTARVATMGDHANAIVAQSISGGGGDGGMGSTSHNQIGGGFNLTAGLGLGGTGGSGGTTGAVAVYTEGSTTLTTTGSGSRGIVAQAIGGGGGTGQGGTVGLTASDSTAGGGDDGEDLADDPDDSGDDDDDGLSAKVTVGVGSTPGAGSVGGNVTVGADGDIITSGDDADGILAQSIGGSGGLAGSVGNDAGDHDSSFGGDDEDTGYELTATIGGAGGQGSNGATVNLSFTGSTITTRGDYADGIIGQSIGGGGGAGGTSTADGSEAEASITLGVGGQGGQGGNGGAVAGYFATNTVQTGGYAAHGVLLQSIGGGGGQGGDGSEQSAGHITVGAAVGGASGDGGNGGTVTFGSDTQGVVAMPMIQTLGKDAYGLLAQSIGGGGGIGGAGTAETDDGDLSLEVTVGGSGGASGNGGAVAVDTAGTWTTDGDRAFAMVAQSIGGGGGIGGASDADNISSITLGGRGGNGGNGGQVDVTVEEGIVVATTGAGSHAIVAQSIGGGGGIAGDASGVLLGSVFDPISDGSNGSGGEVTVTMNGGSVTTTGANAYGILAQSIGGGGGIAGTADGVTIGSFGTGTSGSGNVTVTQISRISATGEGSIGIFAQSDSGGSDGIVKVQVNGHVTGGYGAGAYGVMVAGDNTSNVLMVGSNGELVGGYTGANLGAESNAASADAGANTPGTGAVSYRGDGRLLVDNRGTVTGDIRREDKKTGLGVAGDPAIRVRNRGTGTLAAALNYDADIVNEGRVILGFGTGSSTVRVRGDYDQRSGGETTLAADFNLGRADALKIDGTATLAGRLTIEPLTAIKGRRISILSADGGIVGGFDRVSSSLFSFEHGASAGGYTITMAGQSFADPGRGLDSQQSGVAGYLGQLYDLGDTGMAAAFGALDTAASNGTYTQTLTGLTPGAALAGEAATFQLAQDRLATLLNCTVTRTAVSNGQTCLQMLGSGRWIDQSGGSNGAGYDGHAYTIGLAGEIASESGWRFGGMAGYENSSYSGQGTSTTTAKGGTAFVGLSASRDYGAMTLSGAAVYSQGRFDTARTPGLTAGTAQATASHDVSSLAARIQASWRRDYGVSYVLPSVALDVIDTRSDGYTETGAGNLSLDVAGSDETAVILTPAVELGRIFALNGGQQMRLYGRAGVSLSSIDQYTTTAAFVGANPGATPFLSAIAVPETVGLVSAGVQILGTEAFEMDLRYDGAFGDGLKSQQASLNLTFRF
ncbi:autotransporter outer membrane beta-barrel domain-containing protein [Chachezhania sediminis]|uniref:autotransporter outer membrane beta-barrel domain-containing protein n=1 Tax=Chachezhania sediminis TaxID=2599291 RepID=UPI00131CD460|nr:autotransporter outer membrane beta-barrel domain-containing protein [Chachezhania sediminis]